MDIKFQKSPFKFLLIIFLLLSSIIANAQKYNFQHYGLENGISQLQVLGICQDKAKQIWFATLGGLNCFDGKRFITYSVDDGLASSANYSISSDNNGSIWCGGPKGLTSFTDKGITSYTFQKGTARRTVGKVLTDKRNVTWAVSGRRLYKLDNNQLTLQTVDGKSEFVSDIQLDKDQNICVSLYYDGIYKLSGGVWRMIISARKQKIMGFVFDKQHPGNIIFVSNTELFTANSAGIQQILTPSRDFNVSEFVSLLQDNDGGIWVGTNKGAMLIRPHSTQFFNESNGFSDDRVFDIFQDADNNIWLGTDGSGLYKYNNDSFLIYDQLLGKKNTTVMSMARNSKGDIFLGTNGEGLLTYAHKTFKQEVLPVSNSSTMRVNCLYTDKDDNLWVGTDNRGLWKKSGANSKSAYKQIITPTYQFNYLLQDDSKTMWVATATGCFYIDQEKLKPIPLLDIYCSSLANIGVDSMLVGTFSGVYLVKNKQLDTGFKIKSLRDKYILSLKRFGSFVFIATNDHGLFVWNMKTGHTENINTKDGLYSNTVYSIDVVKGQLWLGTGRGVNKFIIKVAGNEISFTKAYLAHVAAESNENSIMHTDSTVWVGTTGANVYSINSKGTAAAVPNTVVQSVWLFSNNQSKGTKYIYKNGYRLPVGLSLPSDESHLSIKFSAVQFTDETDSKFQYQLDGFDKSYSKPILSDFVDYPSLPPGNYTFRVRAINAAGQFKEPAVFSFTITPTFTETFKFKILLVIILLSVTYGFYAYKRYKDRQEQEYISALKIKEQEFVRRQTSEDFHDDLGNKLTRINMLSELLDKKIDPDKTEEKFLVKQIRSSAAEMYSGTKNILWALNPDNDNLWEVYLSIEKFGIELFSNINIGFHISGDFEEIKKIRLPLGFSRNIILISKELLHNILRHSEAKSVTLGVEITSDRYIRFSFTDDGKGFETDKISEGAGIRNMQNRAKKLNGTLIYHSEPGKGTISTLTIPIP